MHERERKGIASQTATDHLRDPTWISSPADANNTAYISLSRSFSQDEASYSGLVSPVLDLHQAPEHKTTVPPGDGQSHPVAKNNGNQKQKHTEAVLERGSIKHTLPLLSTFPKTPLPRVASPLCRTRSKTCNHSFSVLSVFSEGRACITAL